jgi:hypothetical protein
MVQHLFRHAIAIGLAAAALTAPASADTPQQTFARRWQGKAIVLKQSLYTLVYNERGKLGTTRNNRRDGLTVVTPSNGVYYQFDGRQGRDDVVQRHPLGMVEAVSAAYQPDTLEMRSYRKVEPVVINRFDPGAELIVGRVQIERDFVRVAFIQSGGDVDEPATWLTVKWPVPFSKSLSEADLLEALIRQFFDFSAPSR